MRTLVARAAFLILSLAPAFNAGSSGFVAAQGADPEQVFVYGINAAIPDNYIGTFAPPAAGSLYLLADLTSVVSPRRTEIAFWPITNEYRPNWSALNELVPGVLEVSQNGTVVSEIEATDYTIHFEQNDGVTTAEIFLGAEALAAHERFEARQAAFQQATDAYFQAERAWQEAAAEAAERRRAGETVAAPQAPLRPDPIGIFSNGLNKGMPIDLDPGRYAIRLRGADGTIVPGSERDLTVFAPRRGGVGYSVVPETRWTTPDESPAPNDVIYGEADSALYLEPRISREYPARAWALLQNPQRAAADAGDWEWVNGERLIDARLEVVIGNQVVAEHALTPYQVDQLPGSQLGYDVVEFDADAADAPAAPDFAAYPIRLDAPGEQYDIRLVSDRGEILDGSTRQVRVPANPPISRLFVISVVPLLVGAIAITRRQRRVKLSRPDAG
ncbi:MAG: hypothetical protein H0T18_09275 [Chloroflexia bacterium]|nr:hypothetical protein [Chloroflexia bacterium]